MKRTLLLPLMGILCLVSNAQNFYYSTNDEVINLQKVPEEWYAPLPSSIESDSIVNDSTVFLLHEGYVFIKDSTAVKNAFPDLNIQAVLYLEQEEYKLYPINEVLLKFKATTTASQKNDLLVEHNLSYVKANGIYETYETENSVASARSLYESALLEYAVPDFLTNAMELHHQPNDTYFNQQFYLHNTGQQIGPSSFTGTVDADIDAPEAWDITKGDSSVVIAVIDEGITSNHVDLPNSRQVRLPGSNFGNGNPNDPSPDTITGNDKHGDAVAGIIAATQDNNIGVSGIAPHCKIMPVRISLDSSNYITKATEAILFAYRNGANVINNSYGLPYQYNFFPPLVDVIKNAIDTGVVVVFTTGNYANQILNRNGLLAYPVNQNISGLIGVGASDRNDQQANYSTKDKGIDLVAPSNKSAHHVIMNEANEVWTMDVPGTQGYNSWSNSQSIYPSLGEILPSTGLHHYAFTGRFGGTSAAAPQVAAVAALMLSVNDCLPPKRIKDIILATADKVGGYDYNWSSSKPGHSLELGYGRLNAHKAVQAAQVSQSPNKDLMIRDVPEEYGIEPDTIANILYASEDIWVRNQQDGRLNQFTENPVYDSINPVYVYVRVTNKSCTDANIFDSVAVHWAKASTALLWPAHWNGTLTTPYKHGDYITTLSIGNLKAGTDTIFEIPWQVPDPSNYTAFNTEPWHFCLLARVLSFGDTMSFPETQKLWKNVRNNNNIAWKNVNVVDGNLSNNPSGEVEHGLGGVVEIGNGDSVTKVIKVCAKLPENYYATSIYQDSEIRLILDDVGLNKWHEGGNQMYGLEYLEEGVFKVSSQTACILNLNYESLEFSTLFVGFNFLTGQLNSKMVYKYYVEQFDDTDEFIGGEEYFIHKDERNPFNAEAGENQYVNSGQMASLSATPIGEPATYNWYDENGDLFYSGSDTSFVSDVNKRFFLEVIAHKDGFKDYDKKEIRVRNNYISSINPVPASRSQNLNINYSVKDNGSATLILSNSLQNSSHIIPISNLSTQKQVDISNYITGVYTVSLVVNGVVYDSKLITIN